MRWLIVLVVVGCGSPARWQPPAKSNVEEIATWFMRAALSGDESTARSLTLRSDEVAADPEQWDTIVHTTLDGLAREGAGEDAPAVTATVVERRTRMPDTEVAIVQFDVHDRKTAMFTFVKTAGGWKFSPKN